MQGSMDEEEKKSQEENGFLEENELQEGNELQGGKNSSKRKKTVILGIVVLLLALTGLFSLFWKKLGEQTPEEGTHTTLEAGTGRTSDSAKEAGAGLTAENAGLASTAEPAGTGATMSSERAAVRTEEMENLEKSLREELEEKRGAWSLYMYRFDTGEEVRVNDNEPMISASLIKLFIAGCYLEQVKEGNVPDNYQGQLFTMISESNNGSTNQLIDLLGKEKINEFISDHDYRAGQLNRKMLEKNGTENYTSSRDCGKVLRAVYEGRYISREASERVMAAMKAQIDRNRHKIPAGVPDFVETANKTGELFTVDADGINVDVQNDAAIILDEEHPYVLVVMSAVPSVGEAELHRQIAELSAEVYDAVCGEEE